PRRTVGTSVEVIFEAVISLQALRGANPSRSSWHPCVAAVRYWLLFDRLDADCYLDLVADGAEHGFHVEIAPFKHELRAVANTMNTIRKLCRLAPGQFEGQRLGDAVECDVPGHLQSFVGLLH